LKGGSVEGRRRRVLLVVLVGVVGLVGYLVIAAPPVADDDAYSVDEDTVLTVAAPGVLDGDTDPDGDPLTAVLDSDPANGTLTLNPDGSFTYTPSTHFNGTDTFTYRANDGTSDSNVATVTITVNPLNDAPVADDAFFVTQPEVPVSITLEATDPDVDPFNPETHPLVFAIVSGPVNGVLSGDLAAVSYEEPNKASVELTYTPNAAFVGSDLITFSVTDPTGAFDTAVVQIAVQERPPIVGVLWGTWDIYVTLQEAQTFSLTMTSSLTTVYTLDSCEFRGQATFSETGFSALTLKADFPLGELATVVSTLAFDPTSSSPFSYWRTTTRFELDGIDCTHTFYLAPDSASSYTTLVARWKIQDVSFTSRTKFSGWSFSFDREEIRARWVWVPCGLNLNATLSIECEGFDEFSLKVRDVPLLGQECERLCIYLTLETTFTTVSKDVTGTFTCRSNWIDCLKVLCEVNADAMSIQGVSVYGLRLKTSLPGGVEFRTDTSFTEDKNASVTGYSDYFEKLALTGPTLPCCGSPGRWQIATYFKSGGTTLFGWGKTTLLLHTSLGDQITIFAEVTFSSEEPKWVWTSGFEARW